MMGDMSSDQELSRLRAKIDDADKDLLDALGKRMKIVVAKKGVGKKTCLKTAAPGTWRISSMK